MAGHSPCAMPSRDAQRFSAKGDAMDRTSRYPHDRIEVGSTPEARAPAGAFAIPARRTPLALVCTTLLRGALRVIASASRLSALRPEPTPRRH